MNILYINTSGSPDYQADAVYHGFKSRYGTAVESLSDMWYMYDSLSDQDRRALYGKGFTLYGNIDTNLQRVVTREVALERLRNRGYDLIIYGTITRSNELLEDVCRYYPPNKIVFIDGEDETYIDERYLGWGMYFKRELNAFKHPWVRPVNFAIPKEKIVSSLKPKIRQWAINYPGKPYTYIYEREADYYEDYCQSKYAVTCKKAGWDCLRHYEILANGCLPYFVDIESCPTNTMTTLPKALLVSVKAAIDKRDLSEESYTDFVNQLLRYTRNFLTTEHLASNIVAEMTKLDGASAGLAEAGVNNPAPAIPLASKDFYGPLDGKGVLFLDTMHKSPHLISRLDRYNHIFVHDHIKSASRYLVRHGDNVTELLPFDGAFGPVDEALLELNLPYQDRLADYFIWLRSNLKDDARVKLVVPNAYRWQAIRSLIRGELVSDAYLSNKSVVNSFTPKQITRFLKGMGFGAIKIRTALFTGNWIIRRLTAWFPVIGILHSKVLVVECKPDMEILYNGKYAKR